MDDTSIPPEVSLTLAITKTELLTLIDEAVARLAAHESPIGRARRSFLLQLRQIVGDNEFPLPDVLRADACAMPYVFQELNYDDYDWTTRTADLGRLADIVEIDVIVWSGGRGRSALTNAEYAHYVEFCRTVLSSRNANG